MDFEYVQGVQKQFYILTVSLYVTTFRSNVLPPSSSWKIGYYANLKVEVTV
jgi:hypothetical protein